MGRGLFTLGSILLVVTIGLWIAGSANWVPSNLDDQWSAISLRSSLVLLAASLLLRVVSPVAKQIGKGRCAVCGSATQRGHMYCLDHLQETVNAYRDRTRQSSPPQPKRRT